MPYRKALRETYTAHWTKGLISLTVLLPTFYYIKSENNECKGVSVKPQSRRVLHSTKFLLLDPIKVHLWYSFPCIIS